jgi:hypothetical protein
MSAKQPHRETYRTSRLLDFCSCKELTAQTGHQPAEWPLVALKELVDNALDACEEARKRPEVTVSVDGEGITVTDNGPGLPGDTIDGVLDFSVRVSSREAYCSPTRGAQGNALKTLIPMPFALDGRQGQATISARGTRHEITVKVDPLRQEPIVDHRREPDRLVKTGTAITLHWPKSACQELEAAGERFLQLADDFTFFNPHLTLTVNWFGQVTRTAAIDPAWKKWRPCDPTCSHWYTDDRFERRVAACLVLDAELRRERTVREFVATFKGLAATAK